MLVDFGYAQARAQARHGDRLSPAHWRSVEASDGFAQYLYALRATGLAPRVQHLTATSSPHAIERSLRRDWRDEVANVGRWAPKSWRESITWCARLPDLPAVAHLSSGGTVWPWMRDDPVISEFLLSDAESRRRAIEESAFAAPTAAPGGNLLDWWLGLWRASWPATHRSDPALRELIELIRSHQDAMRDDARSPKSAAELGEELEGRVVRLLHTRVRQPAVIFYHLVLTALELWRLRSGLIRRALFADWAAERAT